MARPVPVWAELEGRSGIVYVDHDDILAAYHTRLARERGMVPKRYRRPVTSEQVFGPSSVRVTRSIRRVAWRNQTNQNRAHIVPKSELPDGRRVGGTHRRYVSTAHAAAHRHAQAAAAAAHLAANADLLARYSR
jgi:hypothetical protein